MFTFGIFTTHIPYIAVLVFYAYFLLTGANKASTGEVNISGNSIKIEIQSTTTVDFINTSNYHYLADNDFFNSVFSDENLFTRKVKIKDGYLFRRTNSAFSISSFNRPPPVIG